MANCKTKKCKCGVNHLVSNGVLNCQGQCNDVCTTPLCGTPSTLSLLAPVIYDEIGINLCATFDIGTDIQTTYPTADHVTLNVTEIGLTYGTTAGTVAVEPINGRPNCYQVTLSNLAVTFIAKIYDCANRLLATIDVPATYLPSDTAADTYDEDTNPSEVELEIYAPYGPAYNETTSEPVLNVIAFGNTNNFITQGLNLMAIPKVLDFDLTDNTLTVGLSLFLQSLYYAPYLVATKGKANTPKGSLQPEDQTTCMQFVEGSLLDLEIRPLELGNPKYEEQLKNDCDQNEPCCCQITGTAATEEEVK